MAGRPSSVVALATTALVAACSVLNGYEPIDLAMGGSGGGGDGGATTGGTGGTGGTVADGGASPSCNEAACEAGSGDCVSCTCLQGLVCDCDPVAAGTPCPSGVCTDGACVECVTTDDCPTDQTCDQNHCVGASCSDGQKNALETDVDCGGAECAPCANGSTCDVPEDCTSIHCAFGVCQPCLDQPDCSDFLYCDVDLGTCEQKKSAFQSCLEDYECQSAMCTNFSTFMVCN